MNPLVIVTLLRDTYMAWSTDRGSRLGAALAFYTLFSLAPLLIIIIAIAALAFGRDIAYTQLIQQIETFVGAQAARVIQSTLENTSRPSSGIVATLIGIGAMLFGSTAVFSELQDALNVIWKVPAHSGTRRALRLVWDRLLAFGMVLVMSLLLLLSILANTVLSAVLPLVGDILLQQVYWWRSVNFLFSACVVTVLFAMVYKVLPDIAIGWGDVMIGAVVTAGFFMAGKFLIELYLQYSTTALVYGAAGSLVILLLWIYYSAQILYFGAEFTKVYAAYRRHQLPMPAEHSPIQEKSHVG